MPAPRVPVLLALLAVAAGAPAAAGTRKIDVGGYRLNLRCLGEGSPVVVLDAGAGDNQETWEWVVPEVRKFTKVCSYDRAGLGRSDAGPTPRTSERIVVELHALLSRAGVRGPYVLAGHSFGGLNVRLYAARHPELVAGLVLVDATPDEYPAVEADLLDRASREKLRTSLSLAPPAYEDELASLAESAASVRAAGPVTAPTRILTAVHRDDSEEFRAVWSDLQRRMAEGFPRAVQVIAETSDHYIQFDQPELVVAAIRELVEAARP